MRPPENVSKNPKFEGGREKNANLFSKTRFEVGNGIHFFFFKNKIIFYKKGPDPKAKISISKHDFFHVTEKKVI